MSTDANRHPQTPSDTDRCCLSMSGGVCWRVLLSVDILSSLEGCLGGVWGYLSGIHGHKRCSDVFGGYLGSPSLHYGAVTLLWHSPERHNFFHLTIMRHQNIKMSVYKVDKNRWVIWFFVFLVPVRKLLKNTVALDHPVVVDFQVSWGTWLGFVKYITPLQSHPSIHSFQVNTAAQCYIHP